MRLSVWLGLLVMAFPAYAERVEVRYVAIGDSYSIGEGAKADEAWPTVLTRNLQRNGIPIELVANPSVTGWTTQQAVDGELPIMKKARPTFATLQIGVNDWVQGVEAAEFRKRLKILLDGMQAILPDKQRLLVVTIPDFSVTPTGGAFSGGRDITKGVGEFNAIIREEAKTRGLPVVDVFALSQKMGGDRGLVAQDGLHPSAKEYAEWERVIFPVAYELLKP